MKSITVGRVEITSLTDVEGAFFRLDQIFPGVMAEQWESYLHRYRGRLRTTRPCSGAWDPTYCTPRTGPSSWTPAWGRKRWG
jgi:hypothetical protein